MLDIKKYMKRLYTLQEIAHIRRLQDLSDPYVAPPVKSYNSGKHKKSVEQFYTRERFEVLEKILSKHFTDLQESEMVLDICIGNGILSEKLIKHGKTVFGFDLSKDSLEYCLEKISSENLHLVMADFYEIPFKERFDAAFCINNFNFPDKEKIIRSIYSVLKKEGLFSLSMNTKKDYGQFFGQEVSEAIKQEKLTLTEEEKIILKSDTSPVVPKHKKYPVKETLEQIGFEILKEEKLINEGGYYFLARK